MGEGILVDVGERRMVSARRGVDGSLLVKENMGGNMDEMVWRLD